MHRIVSEQSATVLYYSLMDQLLLLWVLQPAIGVARFYTTSTTKDNTYPNQVKVAGFVIHQKKSTMNIKQCDFLTHMNEVH